MLPRDPGAHRGGREGLEPAMIPRPIQPEARGPTFLLKIEGKPGTAGIRALRLLLKTLLRRHGFKAVDLREIDVGRR
jgi:hypothetical protein